jgi:hypothetical protein
MGGILPTSNAEVKFAFFFVRYERGGREGESTVY